MVAALALARLRRRPARFLLPALGIAVATAFACAVAGEGVIAGDQAARDALPAGATVRVSGRAVDAATAARVLAGPRTKVVLFQSLRLGGRVVALAAIAPLARWIPGAPTAPCTAARCPLLMAAGAAPRGALGIPGLRLAGRARLASAVPLGFVPSAGLLLTGDADGLARLPGLASVYRTTTWLAPLDVRRLHSWDLTRLERALLRDQADLPNLTVTAPFDRLDAARAAAADAPRRLLLAGGGAAAALIAFVLLTAGALGADLSRELARVRGAGGSPRQQALLVGLEAGGVTALGAVVGVAVGVGLVAALAALAGEPVGEVLARSVATPQAAGALVGGWALVTLLLACAPLAPARTLDLLAVGAVGALALALGRRGGAGDPLPLLLAPLCCLAAGAVVLRLAGGVLRAGSRRGSTVAVRLALLNLARAPEAAAGAAAFLTVSVGLGVFALCFDATLARGAADQAASQVPLDVTVADGPSFVGPLAVASPARWRGIAGGPVLAVRRTQANFPNGAATSTVPLIGVPAGGLRATAALVAHGPVRAAGPLVAPGAVLRVTARATGIGVDLRAVLRSATGRVTTLPLGVLGPSPRVLRARLPGGELAGFELDEPAGLAATSGHQNAESPTGATRLRGTVTIAAVAAGGARLSVAGWSARGASVNPRPADGSGLRVDFDSGIATGVVRPAQPGDRAPLAVLADPATAAAAGADGRLPLSVDGVPITARVVGRLRRFPTVDGPNFVVADEASLAARLDAELPGAGRPDELWLRTPDLARTRARLADPRLAALSVSYRADVEHRLHADAVARGVSRTLGLAAVVGVILAAIGLVAALGRDRPLEHDLLAQGMGPRAVRLDRRLRMAAVGGLGLAGGLAAGILLSRLAVAAVSGSPVQAPFSVPLAGVLPWAALGLFVLSAAAGLGLAGWAATRRVL